MARSSHAGGGVGFEPSEGGQGEYVYIRVAFVIRYYPVEGRVDGVAEDEPDKAANKVCGAEGQFQVKTYISKVLPSPEGLPTAQNSDRIGGTSPVAVCTNQALLAISYSVMADILTIERHS